MDISAGGKQVGQAFIDDLTLVPGDNTSKMKASVDQMKVITLIAGKFSDSNGVIPFDISGNKSVYHGEELPYFTEALKSATLHTKINVTEGLMRGGGEGGLI